MRSRVVLGMVVLAAAALIVVLTVRATPREPFSVEDTSPAGFAAVARLAESYGAEVRTESSSRLGDPDAAEPADTYLVAVPSRLSDEELGALEERARAGATVILAEPYASSTWEAGDRELADTPASPTHPGACDIDDLAELGPIDTAFSLPWPVLHGERRCFGDGDLSHVSERSAGAGTVVTLSDPWLWANARLQPAKESGGQPLDNGAMAMRLMRVGSGVRIVAVAPDGATPSVGGAREPLELLPLPVKLALAQGLVALVVYLWWRGRRLGRPVSEHLPVEIAASELVVAVGDLLRRRGSAGQAAAAMRHDARRELSSRLGVPPGAPLDQLVDRVAARTGRPPDAVRSVLSDPVPPRDEDLVRLAHDLDSIRLEAFDDQPV